MRNFQFIWGDAAGATNCECILGKNLEDALATFKDRRYNYIQIYSIREIS